ncbi:MAG: electron transfer flavoprotein subunit beta/FixA family protein [Micrococcaceae bacterium]
MKIIVLVKSVPDAQFEQNFSSKNTVDRSEVILSELDEYAIEEALSLASENDETIALTMGPENAGKAVKKALQMGIDSGVHLHDEALEGADSYLTAQALAAAIEKFENVGVVLTGMASTDAEMSVIPAMLAEILNFSQVTMVSELSISGTDVSATRQREIATEKLEAKLPAVISVTDQLNTPRYPNFKGILAAKKKEIQKITLEDLGMNNPESLTVVDSVEKKPEREQGTIIADKGDGEVVRQLVDFLEEKNLV